MRLGVIDHPLALLLSLGGDIGIVAPVQVLDSDLPELAATIRTLGALNAALGGAPSPQWGTQQ